MPDKPQEYRVNIYSQPVVDVHILLLIFVRFSGFDLIWRRWPDVVCLKSRSELKRSR